MWCAQRDGRFEGRGSAVVRGEVALDAAVKVWEG